MTKIARCAAIVVMAVVVVFYNEGVLLHTVEIRTQASPAQRRSSSPPASQNLVLDRRLPYTMEELEALLFAKDDNEINRSKGEDRDFTLPPLLQQILKHRNPTCEMDYNKRPRRKHNKKKKETFAPTEIAYLAIARAGSTTLHGAFGQHHCHDCVLHDLENLGTRRVVIALRHPVARISSGLSRRFEHYREDKPANKLFTKTFATPEAYLSALRDPSHPLHPTALKSTVGKRRQSYMLPIYEFYLADLQENNNRKDEGPATINNSNPSATQVRFLCIESLDEDLKSAREQWRGIGINHFNATSNTIKAPKRKNSSNQSSANWTTVLSRFSVESIVWVEGTYKNDLKLYTTFCPEGYESYEMARSSSGGAGNGSRR